MNVSSQNNETKGQISALANEFKQQPGHFKWLLEALALHQLLATEGILVKLNESIDQGPVYDCQVLWLTKDKRFFELTAETEYPSKNLKKETIAIQDVTKRIEVNQNQPGNGKTFGFLAIEVLEELLPDRGK